MSCLAFSPNGDLLATAKDWAGELNIWEVPGGRLQRTLSGHTTRLGAVAFSPDGAAVAGGGGTFDEGETILWRVKDGVPLLILPSGPVFALAFSPDGEKLAAAGDDGVAVWDVKPS